MSECCAAGMTVEDFWKATFREIFNFLKGAGIRRRRDRQLAIYTAWHVEAFQRSKTLKPLANILRQMEPARVMSPQEVRAAIISAAEAMGSTVHYIDKRGR